jgi:hypothetical protein
MGRLDRHAKLQPRSTLMIARHSSNMNLKKNEDSASVGIAQEQQKTNDFQPSYMGT